MAGYQPLKITGNKTGLVQERENFLLPDDAYPILENAYVWRERIKRKQGYELLGRLRRVFTNYVAGLTFAGQSSLTFNIFTFVGITEPNAQLEPGSFIFTVGAPDTSTFTDNGDGTFTVTGSGVAAGSSINYITGDVTLIWNPLVGGGAATFDFNYFPNLPVMGLCSRELNNINNEMLIAFDQTYAYRYSGGWQEFIPGTTWKGNNSDFFWSTNYWVNGSNDKLFWVTNFSGTSGDPIRYADSATWTDFAPTINNIGTEFLTQCLVMLPFRSRLMAFNTLEGTSLATSVSKPQRIRWASIGSPLTADSWVDDVRGKGGFLDIPTSESIVAVGFVRDNLVIYCERSTWQLRYTGRSIAPFQIEKVNSELGAESTFSAVQFDTSLVGIGDKGVVECDSFKSDRIDIKIPDLVFYFDNDNNGPKRVHGVRDFQNRLAFWTYVYKPDEGATTPYPDKRLVYNYENDSWAIFTDSLTCLGTYQPQQSRKWSTSKFPWSSANFPWRDRPSAFPSIVGGNQQGFVEFLDSKTTNDVSLYIENITGNTTTPTVVKSPSHNLRTGQVIKIKDIPTGTPFASSLNDQVFGVVVDDLDNFKLYKYDSATGQFSSPQLDAAAVFVGWGQIAIRDNFRIVSKKFNFIDDGQNIQLGYIDILLDDTEEGAITLNVYLDYNDDSPVNILPENIDPSTSAPDTFFNSVVPTTKSDGLNSSKNWKRVFCSVRGGFITIEWTLSNVQMAGPEQEEDVQIDAQILWLRKAGRQLPIGV